MDDSRRLSAGPLTVWLGRFTTVAVTALVMAMLLTGFGNDWSAGRVLGAIFIVLIVGLVAWFQFSTLPVTVMDHGSHIEVFTRNNSSVIPLASIREVEFKPVMLGNMVTIYLHEPGPLGATITYVPGGGFRRRAQEDVDHLRRRVLQARLG